MNVAYGPALKWWDVGCKCIILPIYKQFGQKYGLLTAFVIDLHFDSNTPRECGTSGGPLCFHTSVYVTTSPGADLHFDSRVFLQLLKPHSELFPHGGWV